MNIVLVLLLGHLAKAISNNRGSGTYVIRKPNDRGPTTWKSGLKCLQSISKLYLISKADQAKMSFASRNMIITRAKNMSTPAAQIQDQFLTLKNEAVGKKARNEPLGTYLTSVVSDASVLHQQNFSSNFISHTDAYVIVVDNFERLSKLVEGYMSKLQSWNPGAKFLILYNHADDRNRSLAVANQVFDFLLKKFYVNTVSLLYAITDTTYEYYILNNFNSVACRKVKAEKVTTCDMGEVTDQWVAKNFIERLVQKANLQNCTFYMCASIAMPFVEKGCDHGIEVHLVDLIRKKLDFKLNVTCGNSSRGIRNAENKTWSELLGRLDNRLCDFILGGFYPDDEVREDFWATDSYLLDSHTWFIATAPARPPWKSLFDIFQTNMWLYIALVLLITWLFWLAFGCILPQELQAHKSPTLTAINSWGVTLGASINERPKCQTSRIFFIGLCLYGLNVTSLYTSKLISVFANPGYEHQISTIDEVIREGIPYGGPAENRDWFDNDDDRQIYTRYNDSDSFMLRTRNLRAVMTGERVILANRMYMLRNQRVGNLYGFPENVFSSPVEIIAKRGFPFLNRFNDLIRRMKNGGLFSKIDKDFLYRYTVLVKMSEQQANKEAVIVLTIYHLEGAFWILIFGTLLSLVAFVGEFLNYKYFHRWLCKICNWDSKGDKGKKKRMNQRSKGERKRREKHESRPVISVRMEQIRFTPIKRRRIRWN